LALKSPPFVDIVTGQPACQETDVWGTMTNRDFPRIWEENDVEVFIGGPDRGRVGGRDAYYEFEVNALNTVYEAFWIWKDVPWPGSPYYGRPEFDPATRRTMVLDGVGGHVHARGERWGFLDWDFPGLRTAVHVDGAVNARTNTDRGWTVDWHFHGAGWPTWRMGARCRQRTATCGASTVHASRKWAGTERCWTRARGGRGTATATTTRIFRRCSRT
jgi:hypothetical protein